MRTFEFRLYTALLSNMAAQRLLVMVNFRTFRTSEHRGDGRLAQGHPHLGAHYNIICVVFKFKKCDLELGGKAAEYLRHTQNAQTKQNTRKKVERWLQQKKNEMHHWSNFKQTKRQTQKG